VKQKIKNRTNKIKRSIEGEKRKGYKPEYWDPNRNIIPKRFKTGEKKGGKKNGK
jgi:hypothetical protein